MKSHFINTGIGRQPKGYNHYKIRDAGYLFLLSKAIYRFELIEPCLTFVFKDGCYIQPGKKFLTDQGTIPKILQLFIPKDRYLLGFFFHDFICKYGYIWVSYDYGITWGKERVTRAQGDSLLRLMCEYDPNPGSFFSRWSVYFGVRIGSLAGFLRKTS